MFNYFLVFVNICNVFFVVNNFNTLGVKFIFKTFLTYRLVHHIKLIKHYLDDKRREYLIMKEIPILTCVRPTFVRSGFPSDLPRPRTTYSTSRGMTRRAYQPLGLLVE